MFSKKITDVKKSTSKIQDSKKDLATRIKHLKNILDTVDIAEAKGFSEANFSHIYHILYESFIQAENNLRQRELSFHLVHKAHKEELECALWILEQVLSLLPELIHKRWQMHSLGHILTKLLDPGNSIKLRRQAIRYFLMWYQALNDNAPDYVHAMFANLVPGIFPKTTNSSKSTTGAGGSSIFHDTSLQNPVTAVESLPILPPSSTERVPEQTTRLYLDTVLEFMVTTVVRLEWHDKVSHHHRCFHFLLEMFKVYYLPKLCPKFCYETSLYNPNLELPMLRKPEADTEFITYRVSLIKWIANYTHQTKKSSESQPNSISMVTNVSQQDDEHQHDSAQHSLDSNVSIQMRSIPTDDELASRIVREVLYNSRDNVNFIHEVYRQAFLLNFAHAIAIRKAITVYKDIIQMNLTELPPYAQEPMEEVARVSDDNVPEGFRPGRLRNDSYLGAIQKENLLVRAGLQNLLQVFMTHAANVFLLEVNSHVPTLLEEQTDACKRVLNIYRYMVMHTRMDSGTWEQLLLVLLQITSLVLRESPPKKKVATLGGKLAPAIFQTLIVTWIKANLNVTITRELWDRFLNVLTLLTGWEELIKEWAKTLETLTRVLARHVYNLDLTDLPLDRVIDYKMKRNRPRAISKQEGNRTESVSESSSNVTVSRQDSSLPDGGCLPKITRNGMSRSLSETNLAVKRRSSTKNQHRQRRSHSLDNLRQADNESTDRTRSPSPAPSSGIESNSIKDSPIQLVDVLSDGNVQELSGEYRGVICGGTVRGWLPDVAVILWRRMLGSLGDVNQISDPKLHAQVFEYLVKLTDTLIKMKLNQGVSFDNQSTPQPPELVPPLTLIVPWCFGALTLPSSYEAGKLTALQLLCTITLNCEPQHRGYMAHFYRALHLALNSASKSAVNTALRHLGPRFMSLKLPGFSLLILDLIHACNVILNSSDFSKSTPRAEAVSILGALLASPDNLTQLSVLEPSLDIKIISCPDIKEHVVNILLRTGRRESTAMARCIALSSLGIFVYRELTNQTYHPKVVDAMNVILLALKFNNKVIAQLASNTLYLLCDYAGLLWSQYPRIADSVIQTLCSALFLHAPLGSTAGETDKALGTALLLCLGEWCMKLGPQRLLTISEYGDNRTCLLLLIFTVLHKIITGNTLDECGGLTQPNFNEDFDPNILLENFDHNTQSNSPSPKSQHCQKAVTLCAKTILAHLVTHLGHFPMAIGAARLSSLVAEHDDVPNLTSDELSANIFTAPNIQLFMLNPNVVASLVELPALDLPGGGVTAGLSTANKQVRVLLRDLSGKACWDASILYRSPDSLKSVPEVNIPFIKESGGKWGLGSIQPESLMVGTQTHLPQRAMRHRNPNILPDTSNAALDLDQLDDLLQYLGHTSPECLESFDKKLNEPALSPVSIEIEQEAIASVISQRNSEIDHNKTNQHQDGMIAQPASRPNSRCSPQGDTTSTTSSNNEITTPSNEFQQCRLLFSQLGQSGWERRKDLHLLSKTERLLRELRNLDNQQCRETHKVAVIYVAAGQEDKNTILSNQGGSAAYEQFLASLAWEVELEGHTGFLGGLHRQGSTGLTAPYIATSFMEAIFHVATRMPGDTPEAVLSKTRHLGNDEVHIVWSEHNRDYRRDIIPTEFCDILIVVYPLGNNLNRVTINCKREVPYFGILHDEAIIESNILAGVIRAAVICGSRAKRSTLPLYQQYYEERARSLDTVVTKHKDNTTFEDFISRVYSPVATPSPFCTSGSASGDASMLCSALLDSHGHSQKVGQREPKFRASDLGRGVWFNNSDVSQNIESTSISPRPLKKLSTSLKSVPRRSLRQETSMETPPDSPTQAIRKK
ncbi:probable Rho GTPase-activating protein CG5521 isoform X1 [Onthophagus taurus]|uniref:probable Rho GTPase-activating protein CG5521 isoform X1 n=1 Tax=Onthophagus taurus TaxID=166361 RepID=UPI0039BDAD56